MDKYIQLYTRIYNKLKKIAFDIVQINENENMAGRIFDMTINALVIINLITVFLEFFNIPDGVQTAINVIEIISVFIFSSEYKLRIWTADLLYPTLNPIVSRLRYIFSFMAILDLVAMVVFYVPVMLPAFFGDTDLNVLKTVLVLRLFKLFKIHHFTAMFSTIFGFFKTRATHLKELISG